MKLLWMAAGSWAALMLGCPVFAQSVVVKPATTQSYGAKQRDDPIVRRTKAYGGYEIVVPGFEDAPARMDMPDGYLVRDRVEIVPGVEIQVPHIDYWAHDGSPPPPTIVVAGRTVHVDFERFLTDPQLWSHALLNETKYELGRGGLFTTQYQFFGLAIAHGKTYIGVVWYSRASENPDWAAVLFRLDWNGMAVEPKQVKMIHDIKFEWPHLPLLLDTLPNGDLLLSENRSLWQMNSKEEFTALPGVTAVLPNNPNLAAYCMMWRRDRWLLIGRQRLNGRTIQFDIVAQEAATGKKEREYTWSIKAK